MRYAAPRTQETICADIRMVTEFMTDRTCATTYALVLDLCDELQLRAIRDSIDEDESLYPF